MKRIFTTKNDSELQRIIREMAAAGAVNCMTVDIKMRRGYAVQQRSDLKIIEKQLEATRTADTQEQTLTQSAIAVGYANAMRNHNLVDDEELKGMLALIEKIANDNIEMIQHIEKGRLGRIFRKKVTA